MFKLISKVLINSIIIFVLSLVSLSLIFLHIYLQREGFFTLRYAHNEKISDSPLRKELYKGQLFRGEFTARDDNLGIVALPLETFSRKNSDNLIFQIKEKNNDSWHHIQEQEGKRFHGNGHYTFGFPKINRSKNKKYVFELVSTDGKRNNAFGIKKADPLLITKYEFTKSEVFSSSDNAIYFFSKKVKLAAENRDYYLAFIIYVLPIFSYLSWILYFGKRLKKKQDLLIGKLKRGTIKLKIIFFLLLLSRFLLLYLVLFGILLDIFLIKANYDLVIIVLILIWLFSVYLYKLNYTLAFVSALFFLILCPIIVYTGGYNIAVKLALWAYTFIWLGLFQFIIVTKLKWKTITGIPVVLATFTNDSGVVYAWIKKVVRRK